MKKEDKLGLNQVLTLIKKGNNPAKISKDYLIPKQTLDYKITKLKKLGCIEKEGYGVWKYLKEIPNRPKDTNKAQIGTKEIRGHAFIWKIDFFGNRYNWLKIVEEYKRKYKRPKLTFQFLANGKVPRTIFMNRKIWLTKEGMVIYEPIDFLGKSSFQVKGNAVFEMDRLIKGILKELKQKFKPYRFTTSREHYAQVKNELARQYNDRKEKMNIKDEYGTCWLWIDNSKVRGFREEDLETNDMIISRQMQNFWNDNKKHKFGVTPSFVLNKFNNQDQIINKSMNVLGEYSRQISLHLEVEKQQLITQKGMQKTQEKTLELLEKIGEGIK